ncbi:hypothetical protein C4552_02130 [Candidatus Parcubacteria bacterium]|nr:MAG: hypothetical protein C4552_02130 [Candidatus Parcubacteria bacterium]
MPEAVAMTKLMVAIAVALWFLPGLWAAISGLANTGVRKRLLRRARRGWIRGVAEYAARNRVPLAEARRLFRGQGTDARHLANAFVALTLAGFRGFRLVRDLGRLSSVK